MVLAASLLPAVTGAAGAAAADPTDPATNIAVASWGTDRLDLFARGTDGTLRHRIYNGRWSNWESLGGAITSGPAAVSWGPGRIDVFARSTTGSVVYRTFSGGKWAAWSSLGGVITGEPAVSSWGVNRLDVFVRGTSNAVHHKAYNGTTWSTAWANLGGTVNSSPTAVSWAANRIDVFARGGANALYQKTWAGSWGGWVNRGGALTSGPSVISGSSGFLDVYARVAGNAISHKSFGYGQWAGWHNLGGTFASKPAVSDWGGAHTDVFARGSDGTLQQRSWRGFSGWDATWRTVPDAIANVPTGPYSRTVALQASPAGGALLGTLEYAYVDNIGRLVTGHQPDVSNMGSVQWTVVSGNEAFAGPPAVAEQPGGLLQVSAMHTSGDVWARAQTTKGSVTWTDWLNQGGAMASAVTVTRQTDGSLALLALDSAGGLWHLPHSNVAGPYRPWVNLGVTGLTGLPTAVAGRDGLQLFGTHASGSVRTATLSVAGIVSAWTDLGGTGLNGTPAVVVYPGFRMRAFARAADGTIVTKMQDAAFGWPAAWSPVGGPAGGGSPAAVLSPQSGRTEILVRGNDGNIYSTGETAQGSGAWREWVPVLFGADVAATDPTAFTYTGDGGERWAFVFRTPDQQNRVYTVDTAAAALTTVTGPRFQARSLPAPPG
jgi:hypothetical protein